MTDHYSVSGQFMDEVIKAFQRMDVNHDEALPDIRGSASDNRIPLQVFIDLLDHMESVAQTPELGLLLGMHMEPSGFNVLGHLVMACNTIGEALSLVAQLQPVVIDCAKSEFVSHEDSIEFCWTPSESKLSNHRVLIDLILSATRHFGIWATGISDPFANIKFQYPKPNNTQLYTEIFGTEGLFNQDHNSFSIPNHWNQQKIRTANGELKPIIYDRAEQILKTIRANNDIVLRLHSVLETLLPHGQATIEAASELLHLSPRTLQRYLKHRATNFSEVLQQVRFTKAEKLLTTTRLPLIEIAAQVGYREQSSFSYAYKNWSGVSPRTLRSKALY